MSVQVHWNPDGNPGMAFGSSFAMQAKGQPKPANQKAYKETAKIKPEVDETTAGKFKVSPWFEDNNYPEVLKDYLRKSAVLGSAIDYKVRLAAAKGLMAVKITGYTKEGKEQYEIVDNPKLQRFLNGRMVRRYLFEAYQNLYQYGNAFPQLIFADQKDRIAVIKSIDAPYCRYTVKNNKGVIEKCIVSGKWPDDISGKEDFDAIDVLDLDGTPDMIEARAKQLRNFIYPINLNTSGNEYYQLPPWDTAKKAGHVDISTKIATYINKMFDNQMAIKYHIKIPYAYWDEKYPKEQYHTIELKKKRQEKIQKDLDTLEENLTTAHNAKKAIISHFRINQQGKPEEKWEIDVIDDKYKSDEYLPQSAASNAEILTSLNIHPAVKGLSLSAGPYSNSEGGSNIREAFLVDNALAWLDRQEVLDPVDLMMRFNFNVDEDVELRTREMVLTTLDEGSGSKTVS
jgi:hypothetical protein